MTLFWLNTLARARAHALAQCVYHVEQNYPIVYNWGIWNIQFRFIVRSVGGSRFPFG